jgi:hypothetical protein
MTAKPKQLRYKGRWLANWQADIRQEIGDLRKALLDRMSELFLELRTDIDSNTKAIGDVRERIGSSLWPIMLTLFVLLISLASLYLGLKANGMLPNAPY